MPDFTKFLDMDVDSIKSKPRFLPGFYEVVVKAYETTESSAKKTPGIKFAFEVTEVVDVAGEDTDEFIGRVIYDTFWFSEDAMFRFKTLFEALRVESAGRKIGAVLEDCVQQRCLIEVQEEADQNNPEKVYARIKAYSQTA